MAFHNTNYEVVTLSGTQTEGELGNGLTAETIHRVYCLTTGSIDITPWKGNTFTWDATAHDFIDIVVKSTSITSGTFIGFKAKFSPHQYIQANQAF